MASNANPWAPAALQNDQETLPSLPDLDAVFGYKATDLDFELDPVMQSDDVSNPTENLELKEESQDELQEPSEGSNLHPQTDHWSQGYWLALPDQTTLRGPGRQRGITDLTETLVHHYSFFNDAVHSKSATRPSHSLAVILSSPKPYASDFAKRHNYQLREHVTFRQARKYVDPISYYGPLPLLRLRGTDLADAVTGHTDKYYTETGTTDDTMNSSSWWMIDNTYNKDDDPIYQDLGDTNSYTSGASMPINGWFKVSDIPTADEYQEDAWQQCENSWKYRQATQSHKRHTGSKRKSRLANDVTLDVLGGQQEPPIVGPVIKGSRTGLNDRYKQLLREKFREIVVKRIRKRVYYIRYFRWAVRAVLHQKSSAQAEESEEVCSEMADGKAIEQSSESEKPYDDEDIVGEALSEGDRNISTGPNHDGYSSALSLETSLDTSSPQDPLSAQEWESWEAEDMDEIDGSMSPDMLEEAPDTTSPRWDTAEDESTPPTSPELETCSNGSDSEFGIDVENGEVSSALDAPEYTGAFEESSIPRKDALKAPLTFEEDVRFEKRSDGLDGTQELKKVRRQNRRWKQERQRPQEQLPPANGILRDLLWFGLRILTPSADWLITKL